VKPKSKLSKAEKKARGRVLAAHRASAARAARLPGKKRKAKKKTRAAKRSKVAPRKKTASRSASAPRAAKPSKKPASKKGVKTMTADAVIKAAASGALKRWVCEGVRRSGCGAKGTRVVTAKGSFQRIRPPRFMAG
jgi:hypothetical protein